MQTATRASGRSGVSWCAQTVGAVALFVAAFPLHFPSRALAMAGIVAFIWTVYLAVSLVRWAAARTGG